MIQTGFMRHAFVASSGTEILNTVRPGAAVALDRAVVVLHEGLRERESQPACRPPAPTPAGWNIRSRISSGMPGPVVDHLQFQCQAVPAAARS